jgi:hypothetical protein
VHLGEVDGDLVDQPLRGGDAVDPHDGAARGERVSRELDLHVTLKLKAECVVRCPAPARGADEPDVALDRAHRDHEAAETVACDGHIAQLAARAGQGRRLGRLAVGSARAQQRERSEGQAG